MTKKDLEIQSHLSGCYLIKYAPYSSFYLSVNPRNCKVVTLDSIGGCLGGSKEHVAKFYQALKLIPTLSQVHSSTCLFKVSLIREKHIEKLKEHFSMVSCVQIPYGYRGGYQYHAIFSFNDNNAYFERLKEEPAKLIEEWKEKKE